MACKRILKRPDALNINTYRSTVNHTNGSLTAMTEIKEYLRIIFQPWLASCVILKLRIAVNAIFQQQSLLQQQISSHALSPALLMFEPQSLLPPLLRYLSKCGIKVKRLKIIINVKHFLI